MTGQDLHELILNKWGYSFDVQLRQTQGKIFIQVMWRYLEQASFPLSPEAYRAHLDTIATYLEAWGGTEQFMTYVQNTSERPRLGKAVSVPLDLGDRTSEWILDA